MYYIYCILLEDCFFSHSAKKLLDEYKIKHEFIYISNYNKDKYKYDKISTFPQIYIKKKNSHGSLLIGGYDNLKELFTMFYKKYNKDDILLAMNNYKFSKKIILRLMQIFNSF